jgi:hypothetical protein
VNFTVKGGKNCCIFPSVQTKRPVWQGHSQVQIPDIDAA